MGREGVSIGEEEGNKNHGHKANVNDRRALLPEDRPGNQ